MKTVLQTQQLKNHDDFCALNQDLPTIRPINYQKSCSIKTFLSSPNAIYQNQHQTKSVSALPLAYKLLLLLQDCQQRRLRCVLKYHPKHADSTKNYPLIQSLFFLIVDIVKFAVTFGLTSRMVTIRAQEHLTSETSR